MFKKESERIERGRERRSKERERRLSGEEERQEEEEMEEESKRKRGTLRSKTTELLRNYLSNHSARYTRCLEKSLSGERADEEKQKEQGEGSRWKNMRNIKKRRRRRTSN